MLTTDLDVLVLSTRSLAITVFLIIFKEMLHRSEQVRTKFPPLALQLCKGIPLEHSGKELLRQILGIGAGFSSPAGIGIERVPVVFAQVVERVSLLAVTSRLRFEHDRPTRGWKSLRSPFHFLFAFRGQP